MKVLQPFNHYHKGNLNLLLLVKETLQNILMTNKQYNFILIEHNIAFIGFFTNFTNKLIFSIYQQQNYN